jgi:hypothetical protein
MLAAASLQRTPSRLLPARGHGRNFLAGGVPRRSPNDVRRWVVQQHCHAAGRMRVGRVVKMSVSLSLLGRARPFPRPDRGLLEPLRAVSVKDGGRKAAQRLVLDGHGHSGLLLLSAEGKRKGAGLSRGLLAGYRFAFLAQALAGGGDAVGILNDAVQHHTEPRGGARETQAKLKGKAPSRCGGRSLSTATSNIIGLPRA